MIGYNTENSRPYSYWARQALVRQLSRTGHFKRGVSKQSSSMRAIPAQEHLSERLFSPFSAKEVLYR